MVVKQVLMALALAAMAEGTTEYLLGPWFELLKAKWKEAEQVAPMKYVSAAVGVGFAFAYQLDLLATAFEIVSKPPWVGVLLTGILLGRGANFVHDFAKRYLFPTQEQ